MSHTAHRKMLISTFVQTTTAHSLIILLMVQLWQVRHINQLTGSSKLELTVTERLSYYTILQLLNKWPKGYRWDRFTLLHAVIIIHHMWSGSLIYWLVFGLSIIYAYLKTRENCSQSHFSVNR